VPSASLCAVFFCSFSTPCDVGPWIVLLQSRPLIDLPFDHGTEELCHLVTKWLQVVLI